MHITLNLVKLPSTRAYVQQYTDLQPVICSDFVQHKYFGMDYPPSNIALNISTQPVEGFIECDLDCFGYAFIAGQHYNTFIKLRQIINNMTNYSSTKLWFKIQKI